MRKPFYKVCHLGHGVFALIKNDKPNRKSYQCMMADIKEKQPMKNDHNNQNEVRLRGAGLRMALKLLPPDLLKAAPQHLENYLKQRLEQVEPERHEAGACFLIAPHAQDGHLRVMTVALDEQNAVSRIVSETTLDEIFKAILENMKEL